MPTFSQPARRWRAGLVVLVVVLSVVGASRLSIAPLTATLAGGEVGAATRSQERQFGGEPLVVSIAGPLGSTLAPNGISALIELEGRLAKLDGVAAVVGPGGFINQSTIQADRLVTAQLGPTARRASRAGDRARRSARRRGVSAADAAQIGDRARIAALGADRSQFERTLARLGGIGLPSIANPAYVNAIVFGSGNAPKARFRWLFPDADHAVILVRPEQGLSPRAVVDLDRKVRVLATRAPLRGAKATVGGAAAAAAAAASDVPIELGRVALLTVLLLAALVLLVPRGPSRRTAATMGGVSVIATAAGVLAASAVGQDLSLATVVAVPVLLAITMIVAFLTSGDARVDATAGVSATTTAAVGLGAAVVAVAAAVRIVGVPVLSDLLGALAIGAIVGSAVVVLTGPVLRGRERTGDTVAGDNVLRRLPTAGRAGRVADAVGRLPMVVRAGVVVVAGVALIVGLALTATPGVRSDPARLGPAGLQEARTAQDVARQVGVAGELRIALRGDVTSPASVHWLDGLGARARRIDRRTVVGPNVGELLAGEGRPTASRIASLLAVTPAYLLKPMISTDRSYAEVRVGIPPVGAVAERALVRQMVAAIADPPNGLRAEPAGLLAAAEHSDRRLEAARHWLPGTCLLVLLGGLVLRRRSLSGVLVPLVPALAGAGGVGLLTAGLGIEMSPVVAAVLPVGLVLALALGLLAEDATVRGPRTGARRAAISSVGLPAILVVAAGLGLFASRIGMVREFGGLLAADVLLSTAAAIVVVPALQARLAAREERHRRPPVGDAAGEPERSSAASGSPVVAVESDVPR